MDVTAGRASFRSEFFGVPDQNRAMLMALML